MLQTEKLLKERYQLKKNLGQNAVRQTWLAQDIEDPENKLVVVKLLAFNPQMTWDEIRLFEREAQVLKELKHPQIPQYVDYFSIDEETGDGLPWFALVQAYIPGNSLKQLLERGTDFSEKQARSYATQIIDILIYLHELSPPVIHRDIKPSNLILGKDEKIYLVDFGSVQDKAKAEGVTFTVVGTSGYAPPEQLWGKTVPASDLYALGATLIHLLTGTFPSEIPQKKMQVQFQDKVNLSPDFTKWLKKLIAPAPEQRFSSARQALEALQVSDTPQILEKSTNRSKRLIPLVFTQITVIGVLAFIWYLRDKQLSQFRGEKKGRYNVEAMNDAQQAYFLGNNKFTNSLSELGRGIMPVTDYYKYSIQVKENIAFNYAVAQKDNISSYVGAVSMFSDSEAEVRSHLYKMMNPKLQQHQTGKFAHPPKSGIAVNPVIKDYKYLTQVENKAVFYYGVAQKDKLRSYVGAVFKVPTSEADNSSLEASNQVEEAEATESIVCQTRSPSTQLPRKPFYRNGDLECAAGTVQEFWHVPSPEEIVTTAIVCETNSPSTQIPSEPVYRNGQFECSSDTHD